MVMNLVLVLTSGPFPIPIKIFHASNETFREVIVTPSNSPLLHVQTGETFFGGLPREQLEATLGVSNVAHS